MLTVVAPAAIAASSSRHRKSGSERPASSGENSTLSVYSRAQPIALIACSNTWSAVIRSFICMWIGELAMNVWMRIDFAGRSASPARRMSFSFARASAHTVLSRIALAMSCTASKSPFDDAGNPASITSTRSRSSCRAMRVFSSLRHRRAGALLAIAQRRVEDDQVVGHRILPSVTRPRRPRCAERNGALCAAAIQRGDDGLQRRRHDVGVETDTIDRPGAGAQLHVGDRRSRPRRCPIACSW